jgi:N-hydroxyarylamine O-acetyltransferase
MMVMYTNSDKTKSNIIAYFNRIGYKGSTNVSLETLSQLQECHIYTVPYENLDILNGVPLSLEIKNLFNKIVTRNRGGLF